MSIRAAKYFVVSWEKGTLMISRAREIVPNRIYEIIKTPDPYLTCIWNNPSQQHFPIEISKALGEKEKKKSSDF